MNGYSASKAYFNWAIEHPREASTSMGLLYLYLVEICNRLGWRETFGITSGECRAAISVSSYNTYQDALHRLVRYGFVEIVEKSKNQYSPTIIKLINVEDQGGEHVASSNFGYAKNDRAKKEAEDVIIVGPSVGPSKIDNATETFINNKHKTTNINNNNNDYVDCVVYDEFKDFEDWIKTNAPNVAKMREPFTREQFERLFAEYDPNLIYEKLGAMHNYKPLLSKCNSANLTIRNWLRRDSVKTHNRGNSQISTGGKSMVEKSRTLLKEALSDPGDAQSKKITETLEAVAGALIS